MNNKTITEFGYQRKLATMLSAREHAERFVFLPH